MKANRKTRRAAQAHHRAWLQFRTVTTPPKLRRALLLGVSGLALAVALGVTDPARALNECGVVAPGGTATCTTAGNTFPNGIQYQVVDLTIVVQDGVIIDTTGVVGEPGGVFSGGLSSYGDLVVKAGTGGGTGVAITTDGDSAPGIYAGSDNGSITIYSTGIIATGGADARGILANTSAGNTAVIVNSTGDITTAGKYGRGIEAAALGAGSYVFVTSVGNVTTKGSEASGVYAITTGKIGKIYANSTGDITTSGFYADGIRVGSTGDDADIFVVSVGDITTAGRNAEGIEADTTGSGAAITISSTGDISTDERDARGIRADTKDGDIAISSVGSITTGNEGSEGIFARSAAGDIKITSMGDITASSFESGGIYTKTGVKGTITIASTGNIATDGQDARAIFAQADDGVVTITSTGNITTKGVDAEGINATADDYAGVSVTSTGNISTEGSGAEGINAAGDYFSSVVVISNGNISTKGDSAAAINAATGDGFSAVTVKSYGNIQTEGSGSIGIHATAAVESASVTSIGDLSISGDKADGIFVSAGHGAAVNSEGDITTSGNDLSRGIVAYSESTFVRVTSDGNISTNGDSSQGIRAGTKAGYAAVTVTSTGNISTAGEDSDGIYATTAGQSAKITVTSTGNITSAGEGASGIDAVTNGKSAAIKVTSTGDIVTKGDTADGIYAGASGYGSTVSVYSTGNIATGADQADGIDIAVSGKKGFGFALSIGDITTSGDDASGIAVASTGDETTVFLKSTGNIATAGDKSSAIDASSTGQVASVFVDSTGDITTAGDRAEGIDAATQGKISSIFVTSVGDIATTGYNSVGIRAAASEANSAITITSTGDISGAGENAGGISATTESDSSDIVVTTNGDITTTGEAIFVYARGPNSDAKVISVGDITTLEGGRGIGASSKGGSVRVESTGSISTLGQGISAFGGTNIQVYAHNTVITASGKYAGGIFAGSKNGGQVIVFGGDIAVSGQNADGIDTYTTGEAFVSVRGDTQGGWGIADGVDVTGNDSSQIQILDGASVGALSDLAIRNRDNAVKISNLGTITGYVELGGGDDVLKNISATSFDLRYFRDTDGDGTRDTELVAISDFGAGVDAFDNTGTLRLAAVSAVAAWDTTGQIAHPGGGNSDITQDGVEQGFLTNLETFEHSGLITLADGTAGDLLVITDQADGATAGNNVFTHNGGSLALDVVLDDGSSGQSDVLILDKSVLGSGATAIVVTAVDSPGGDTGTGDGILVVNARTASDGTEFVLGNTPVAGAYQYDLFFQNQAGTDQNWYLRSSFFEGALEYPAIATGALLTWYSDLGGLHERLSERRQMVEEGNESAVLPAVATAAGDTSAVRMNDSGQGGWFRVIGGDYDIDQDGPSDFDLETVRAEAGFDVGFDNVLSEDWLVLGAFAGYGWSGVGFDSGSNIDFDIATLGAYATYFRGPYYLDALVKFDWLDGDYESDNVSDDGDVEIPVIGLSLETGYRFDLTDGGLYLQPQAQLSYAHAGDDRFTDDGGSEIELEDSDSLRGRLGLRLGQELGTTAGVAAEPVNGNFYFEASVNQEFLGETDARVSGLTLDQELPETTFEVGGGFDIALPKDGVTFTLDADYTFGEDAEGIGATAGFRINW